MFDSSLECLGWVGVGSKSGSVFSWSFSNAGWAKSLLLSHYLPAESNIAPWGDMTRLSDTFEIHWIPPPGSKVRSAEMAKVVLNIMCGIFCGLPSILGTGLRRLSNLFLVFLSAFSGVNPIIWLYWLKSGVKPPTKSETLRQPFVRKSGHQSMTWKT